MRRIYNNKNKRASFDFEFLGILAGILIVIALIAGIVGLNKHLNASVWNNGYCPDCEIEWTYIQIIGHKSTTTFMYYCKNCNKTIECDHEPNWNEVLPNTNTKEI